MQSRQSPLLPSPLAIDPFSAGLGLRAEFSSELLEKQPSTIQFLEITPENWMGIGGLRRKHLNALNHCYPMVAHGLSLSIGGPSSLNYDFLNGLKRFFTEYGIQIYSEHLSYCTDQQGYLYELLPIPFTTAAVDYVSSRIQQVQDYLGMRIAFENASYYYAPYQEMSEIDFINAILNSTDCQLLLDVNNVWVNSVNHGYDPWDFIQNLPSNRIAYLHIAGHLQTNHQGLIDTHGTPVSDQVWSLLNHAYRIHGPRPTVLERDQGLPPLDDLLLEVGQIKIQLSQAGMPS